jgi:hypothetical protein
MSQQKHNKIQPLWFSLKFKPNSKAKQNKKIPPRGKGNTLASPSSQPPAEIPSS